MNKAMEKVNNLILKELENGVIPWEQPWKNINGIPIQNYISKAGYHGINPLLLSIHSREINSNCPFYATFNQIRKIGGKLIKGSHGSPIVFFDFIKPKNPKPEEKDKLVPFLKYFTVFNLDQTDIDYKDDLPDPVRFENQIKNYHALINGYKNGPEIKIQKSNNAFYDFEKDIVSIPSFEQYKNEAGFYEILVHELIHSTGNEKRLKRDLNGKMKTDSYAKEELIAEIGSAYVNHHYGIPLNIENSSSYINSWQSRIREHTNILVTAFSKAEKAGDYLIDNVVYGLTEKQRELNHRRLVMSLHS